MKVARTVTTGGMEKHSSAGRSVPTHSFGHQCVVVVLTRGGLPLPGYLLADEKHRPCLTDQVYLPTIVYGRVILSGLYRGGECCRLDPVRSGVSAHGVPARAVVSGPGHPHRGLRQHGQKYADAVPWGASGQLSAPRAYQAPKATGGDRVPGPQGLARICAGPTGTALGGSRHHHGWSGQ